jgi:hypothetical protein
LPIVGGVSLGLNAIVTMTRFSLYPLSLALAVAPMPVMAQAMVQAVPGTTDADRLAAQMRLLAVNANDLAALLAAGELSLKLEDLGAAASFFARADKVDPRNGRAKAGEAAILVHAERPGEALRYFAMAESFGLAPAAFAADRGLAYDLIGENERAQRDYRLALRTAPDEETQRRYALSLAIAGKRDLADQQLQPLLRRSDRAAWRARAFTLAMAGNVAEASRIATTMMPPGTAAGLQPFLERLPTLGTVDRAFAVHFGEVRSTPQRVADARLVPALAALGPDPYAPRAQVALASSGPGDKDRKRKEKDRNKGRGKDQPVQVAAATPVPVPVPLPQAPQYRTATANPPLLASRAPLPAVPAASTFTQASSPMVPVRPATAAAIPSPVVPAAPAPYRAPPVQPGFTTTVTPVATAPGTVQRPAQPGFVAPAASVAAGPFVSPVPALARPATVVATTSTMPGSATPPPEGNVTVAAEPVASSPAPVRAEPAVPSVSSAVATVLPPPVPVGIGAVPVAAAGTTVAQPGPAAPPPSGAMVQPIPVEAQRPAAPPHRRDGLSGIVASLPIPAAELGVAGPARPSPAVEARAPEPPVRDAAAERAAAAKALADKRAADRKAAAEKKALAEKKAAAAEKAQEEREAAAQKKLERANPERIWVQVAGGANEDDLAKAWAAAKAKGGDAFAGHTTGWTTPLRFTHRVLAGPFKTDAEARAFVNKLKGEGLSAFTFTSDAGQPVTRLSAK